MLTVSRFLLLVAVAGCSPIRTPPNSEASGFGMDTRGGLGGSILRVTNLDANGPGSLRAALSAEGPRLVVFEVGGVIDLGKTNLVVTEPYLTVAGQTAPSPGITIIRGGLSIQTHDVRIQHIRVRPGDAGASEKSGWEPDGISAIGGQAYNVHIDHCSVSWAVDENVSTSGPRLKGPDASAHNITVSHSIIAEGLDYASHKKGRHSKGMLVHDFSRNIAVIGNLFAHNDRRNPYFKSAASGVVVNNVIYNPGSAAVQLGYIEDEWKGSGITPLNPRVSVVGNVLYYGRDTYTDLALVAYQGDVYLEDNRVVNSNGEPMGIVQGVINKLDIKPSWPAGLKALSVGRVTDYVIARAGARPKDRDETDKRIVKDFLNRKGRILDSQEQVGGYPEQTPTRRLLDPPDGDIGAWLARFTAEVQ